MSVFVILMIIGLIGLAMMAVPGLNRHGHSQIGSHSGVHVGGHLGHGHGAAPLGHGATHAIHAGGAKLIGSKVGGRIGNAGKDAAGANSPGLLRLIPSPRMVFSLMTLWGGFGVALNDGLHLQRALAALLAIVPAVLIERFAVTPVWNKLMTLEGIPSSPLEELTFCEAEAVTPFRNGKGMVSVERDGRMVQFRATLPEAQAGMPVRVGDKLRIEEVDAEKERVTVSIH